MMKTEISTNGEAPVELKEHRRGSAIPDHDEKSSEHRHEDGSSGEDKKRSLFRRPGVIVAAAALAIAGIGYGAFAIFPSFTHESTDDAFIDVHFVSVAPKIAAAWPWCMWMTINWSKKAMSWSRSIRAIFK